MTAQAATKEARKKTGAKQEKPSIKIPSGWNTSDEDEIARRRLRAMEEKMNVACRDPSVSAWFGDFDVQSAGGRVYSVEIRSLMARINSCSCADYATSGLGTCKHVEKTLLSLEKKGARKFRMAAQEGSPRIEVYADSADGRVRVAWPHEKVASLAARRLLNDFFSADGTLLADPETALPAIKRLVEEAPVGVRKDVRLSQNLDSVRDSARDMTRRQEAKQFFLEDVAAGKRSDDVMKLPLYDYQKQGMMHLAFTERAILADEMGLGKTVQAIAACELLRRLRGVSRVLVVTPTSLKVEWQEQIEKFSGLPVTMVYGPRAERLQHYQSDSFFIIANYEQVVKDHEDIQRLVAPDIIVLDEAQRIKNWRTKTASVIKQLQSRYAFVLTGTPVENRIDDIYSIVQMLDPNIFGSLFRFNRDFYRLDPKGRPAGYQNLDRLHQRLKPVLLRRRKGDVEGQLPGRTVNNYFVPMSQEQKARYADYEGIVAKLAAAAARRPLQDKEFKRLQMALAAMRMLCDTPYILDEECRICPKLEEMESLLEEALAEPDNKIIIFSEWERMLSLIREKLEEKGVGFAWHTGSVDQRKRPAEIRRFKDDPDCRVFLSTDSGSVGLNLQAANIVINVDLPWNPAKLEQRIARAWRKHQTRTVHVINLVSEGTIESRMLGVLKLKQAMADNVLEADGDASMDLPSGRAAMVKRLNEMMGQADAAPVPQTTLAGVEAEAAETDALDRFREETVAKLEPRLRRFEAWPDAEGTGRKTILAVVEGSPEGAREQMRETLAASGLSESAALEVLDRETFATIERLVKAGVLSFNQTGATPLHRVSTPAPSEQNLRRKRAVEARALLQKAERGERLAALLAEGGFFGEALPPCREVFGLFLQAFARGEGRDEAGLPDEHFPADVLALTARLCDENRVWDKGAMEQATAALRSLRRFVEGMIDALLRDKAA